MLSDCPNLAGLREEEQVGERQLHVLQDAQDIGYIFCWRVWHSAVGGCGGLCCRNPRSDCKVTAAPDSAGDYSQAIFDASKRSRQITAVALSSLQLALPP